MIMDKKFRIRTEGNLSSCEGNVKIRHAIRINYILNVLEYRET